MNIPQKISYLPKTVYSDKIVSECEKEYEIPDNMPDISRLIRMDSAPFVNAISVNGGVVCAECKNSYNILYLSDDNKIHPLNFSDNFTQNIDTKSSSETMMPTAKVFCTFVSCKVISPRKIYIKSKNKIDVDIKETIAFNTPNTEVGNNVLFYNTESVALQEFRPPVKKTFNLTEEFTLEGSYPPIDDIIFSTVRLIPMDLIKNIGTVTLNTSAIFKAFYESNGSYFMFSRSVPVSLTVDDDEIDESTLVYYTLFLNEQSAEKDVDNYGEDRVIRFEYSPEIVLFKIKETTENLPIDVFSPTDILENETVKLSFDELSGIISRSFTLEKIFEIPDSELTEIYDTSAVMDSTSFEKIANGMKLDGICSISILGNTSHGIDSANFTVNFSEEFPELSGCSKCECTIIPVQSTAMITGRDLITVRVSANVSLRQYNLREHMFLSSFSTKTQRSERDKSYVTLYFPNKNDTIWNISKEYGVNPDLIFSSNPSSFNKDGSIISPTKSIFIP